VSLEKFKPSSSGYRLRLGGAVVEVITESSRRWPEHGIPPSPEAVEIWDSSSGSTPPDWRVQWQNCPSTRLTLLTESSAHSPSSPPLCRNVGVHVVLISPILDSSLVNTHLHTLGHLLGQDGAIFLSLSLSLSLCFSLSLSHTHTERERERNRERTLGHSQNLSYDQG
jgi:hypothetical protein